MGAPLGVKESGFQCVDSFCSDLGGGGRGGGVIGDAHGRDDVANLPTCGPNSDFVPHSEALGTPQTEGVTYPICPHVGPILIWSHAVRC